MKKVLPILILVVLSVVVGYVLMQNRKEMEEATSLAEALVERIPVTTYLIQPKRITEPVTVSGKLTADTDLMLMATTQGRIERIAVKKGDLVRSGQLLATVESDLFREQYEVAKSAYDKLKKDEERFRIMAESEAITRQQLEGMELNLKQAEARYLAAKKQLDDTRITSPVTGYINQLFLKEGGVVGPGVPVAEIVSNEQLKVSLKISERDMPAVRNTTSVPLTIGTGDSLSGSVSFVGIKPDYSGLYPVDISFSGSSSEVYSGQLATAHFMKTSDPDVTYIPQSALLGYGEASRYVYLAEDGKARKVEVEPLETVAGYVGVSGLAFNDRVILKGNTLVSDGQMIQEQ